MYNPRNGVVIMTKRSRPKQAKGEANKIAEKLKELRLSHGYTQVEVAVAADIRQQTYSAYESGKRTPGPVPLFKIASFYGIPVDDFLKLCLELDDNVYFDAPAPSAAGLEMMDFLDFTSDNTLSNLSPEQKELLYFFSKLDKSGRRDLIDYASYKLSRKRP